MKILPVVLSVTVLGLSVGAWYYSDQQQSIMNMAVKVSGGAAEQDGMSAIVSSAKTEVSEASVAASEAAKGAETQYLQLTGPGAAIEKRQAAERKLQEDTDYRDGMAAELKTTQENHAAAQAEAEAMLATKGDSFEGKTVAISGSGNVAQFAAQKALQLGAKVVTMSDSNGSIYDPEGIDAEKLAYIMELKNIFRGRIREYVQKYPTAQYFEGERPWGVKCDIAMPCATQNELNEEEARTLLANGCICVAEGANMPCTPEAIEAFQQAKILYSPGKASNAGGVATSGLEMTQNSIRLKWTREEVDTNLRRIMTDIHEACVKYGTEEDGYVNYVKGANIAGFIKVAEAMMAQGLV
jgi:hypothetical protein